ncbi:hypothetical protein VTJ49DRAFT_3294 [Mycothermus thermophilus]|uniref:CMP/dCMP-type deaminase domain-containing protein n=1 Tax=Humicola insolens TaxID=85995 RepID=A0ABR3V7V1_HUMIN
MADMARQGSVGAFSGFSVCQPALGAALLWLPALGTPELDEMIHALLPGPASIQDKRAHISMDFFEYSRRTGENFKFYPVPAATAVPVTASPATSASSFVDSGYASSFGTSPVLSEGSWAQSPAEAKPKARASTSKKPATASRAQTIDFSNHPGMRILTKDGRDVTNSASRGCKTKEQRDHAHLMRIIKACDTCRRKKVRCDPSHRKRAAPAASTQQEQKPAKRTRTAQTPSPAAVVEPPVEFVVAQDAVVPDAFAVPALDMTFPEDLALWNEFVTLDQEPVAVAAPEAVFDDFLFDNFDLDSFVSPSLGSSATSPSQILTPYTPAGSRASPTTTNIAPVEVAADAALDLNLPYLNPGVALGTDYVDFNLYSPPAETLDEDPILQLRDLGSQQQSPATSLSPVSVSPRVSTTDVVGVARSPASQQQVGVRHNIATSPVDVSWYYDPGDTGHSPQLAATRHNGSGVTANHNNHGSLQAGVEGNGFGYDQVTTAAARHNNHTSTVVANVAQSSVDRSPAAETRYSCVDRSVQAVANSTAVSAAEPCSDSKSIARHSRDSRQSPTMRHNAAAALAASDDKSPATFPSMHPSTLPTRCNVAGKEQQLMSNSSFQLAVFGLVSLLCVAAFLRVFPAGSSSSSQAAQQLVNNVLLVVTSLSLTTRCSNEDSNNGVSTTIAEDKPEDTGSGEVAATTTSDQNDNTILDGDNGTRQDPDDATTMIMFSTVSSSTETQPLKDPLPKAEPAKPPTSPPTMTLNVTAGKEDRVPGEPVSASLDEVLTDRVARLSVNEATVPAEQSVTVQNSANQESASAVSEKDEAEVEVRGAGDSVPQSRSADSNEVVPAVTTVPATPAPEMSATEQIPSKIETPEQKAERAMHSRFMREALDMARLALRTNETPVGCVLIHEGRVIARGMNATNVTRNGTRHAELMAICALLSYGPGSDAETEASAAGRTPLSDRTNAGPQATDEDPTWGDVDPRSGHLYPYGQKLHPSPRVDVSILRECILYVTVEPCVMCASLLRQLQIKKVYFGAVNDKFGGTGGVFRIHKNSPHAMVSAPPSPAPQNGKGLARPPLEPRPASTGTVENDHPTEELRQVQAHSTLPVEGKSDQGHDQAPQTTEAAEGGDAQDRTVQTDGQTLENANPAEDQTAQEQTVRDQAQASQNSQVVLESQPVRDPAKPASIIAEEDKTVLFYPPFHNPVLPDPEQDMMVVSQIETTNHLPGDGGNIERGYKAEGGWGRDEAVTLLRQFYVQENNRAPVPRKKEGRAARLAAMIEQNGHPGSQVYVTEILAKSKDGSAATTPSAQEAQEAQEAVGECEGTTCAADEGMAAGEGSEGSDAENVAPEGVSAEDVKPGGITA